MVTKEEKILALTEGILEELNLKELTKLLEEKVKKIKIFTNEIERSIKNVSNKTK